MAKGEVEETGGFKRFKDRMGAITEIEIEKIIISEFNTRCRFVDENQVQKLMRSMEENGFIPKCAVWMNATTEDGTKEGKILHYRLVAGRHRHEAAMRTGIERIPCQIFYNLKQEEECELDRLDNKLDETHKPVHFLNEAEHLKFLQEKKEWPVRKIARHTGIERTDLIRKLKIAYLPDEAKTIIGGGAHGHHFIERHFREICKLKKDPHIITVCAKIAERGELAEKKIKGKDGKLIQPMRQSEISEMVNEYLEKENKGEIERTVKKPLPQQIELFSDEEEDAQEEEYVTETIITREEKETEDEEHTQLSTEPLPELTSEILYRSPEGELKGVYFERFPRWVKLTGLIKELGYPAFMVMKNLGEFDVWYLAGKEGTFYLSTEIYGDPLSILAEGAGVSKEHVQKKILPDLEKRGYIEYEFHKGEIRFKFNWDTLVEVYKKTAFGIPAKEGGLKNIPSHFSGIIKPTHFHHIRVVKGKVTDWFGKEAPSESVPTWGQSEEKKTITSGEMLLVKSITGELHIEGKEAERIVRDYPKERIEKALSQARDKQNPAGWFLTALKENYALESGDGKDLYAKLRRETDNCFRNCGGGCASDFKRYNKEKDACFWCSKFDSIRDKMTVKKV